MKKRCNWCDVESEEEDFVDDGACSTVCRNGLNRAYDNYVTSPFRDTDYEED